MARARLLKPGFFINEVLAELCPEARLCFAGLWTLADREGRLEDRPRRIKIDIFPYDKVDVDPLLDQLADTGFILRYDVDGMRVIQIVNFLVHQTPHFKEPASTLPSAQGHQDSGVVAFGIPREQRDRVLKRDKNRCQKCGAGDRLSIDHKVPRSRGGSGEDDNLQVLCVRCNSRKGNRLQSKPHTSSNDESALDHQSGDIEAFTRHLSTSRSPDPETETETETETVPETESETETETVIQAAPRKAASRPQPVEIPDDNVGVITKIVHTVLDVLGMQTSLVDLTEGVKERCAHERIVYTSAVVGKAIDSALKQRSRRT